MTLESPGGSLERKSNDGSNDKSDISNQNSSLRRIRKAKRRLPQKSSPERDKADAKSKNIFRASSSKNVLNIPQHSEVIHSRVVIRNNHKLADKITCLFNTSSPEAKLPLKILQKPETSPPKPIANKFAPGLLNLNCSLPLLNNKVFIDDWSASTRNESLPISVIGLSPNSKSLDHIANSTATSVHCESTDLASLSVSTILNDSYDPSISKILQNESFDITSLIPSTPLSQTIDPTTSSVAVSPHDENVDPASISVASIPDVESVNSAANAVAQTQFCKIFDSKTETFDPASNFVALTPYSPTFSPEAMNLDPTFNPVAITPSDQSFQPMFNSSVLEAHTLSVDSESVFVESKPHHQSSKSEESFDPVLIPAAHTPLSQNIDPISSCVAVASLSIASLLLEPATKKRKAASKSAENTQLNQSSNSETKNINAASKLIKHMALNQNNSHETKNIDLASKKIEHKPLNQSVSQKNKKVKASSKLAGNTVQNRSSNSDTQNNDPSSKPVEHTSLNQSVSNETKNLDSASKSVEHESLNQSVKLETKKGKVASKSGGNAPLNQNSNSETKNVDAASKLVEPIRLNQNSDYKNNNNGTVEHKRSNQSVKKKTKKVKSAYKSAQNTHLSQSIDSETKNVVLSSTTVQNLSLNRSISNETKNLDSASKLVRHDLFNQSERKTKKDKTASKSTGNTPQNQSINTKPKNVDATSKLVKQTSLDQSITHKTKNIDIASKSAEHEPLNQSLKQKLKKGKAASKSAENTLSQSINPETKNVNPTFKSTENRTLNQNTTLDTKNIDLTSKSTTHTPINQSINPGTKNIGQAAKSAEDTPLNQSFQPLFNSSALTSNSQSIDSASISISSISYSQSSFNPDAKPFIPLSRSISHVVPSQSFESTSKWIANLPYSDCDDTASISAVSISQSETKPTFKAVTRKSRNRGSEHVILNCHKQDFDPNSDPIVPALHSPGDRGSNFVASHNSNLDSAPNFGNEIFEPKSNKIGHTRDLASITTLSIPHDENVELKENFSVHTPLNHSFDPSCNSTELVEHDQGIEDNLATHTTHSQSSNSAEPRTHSKQAFDPILNDIALLQYHQNFGYNLNTDLRTNQFEYISQNQSFESAVEFSASISHNQNLNRASGLVALPPQTGSVSAASSFDKHSLKNKNVRHVTNSAMPTPQNHAFNSALDIVNESSHNQSFYTASDSVTKTPQNQSFSPVSNSIIHTPYNQRFKRASNSVDNSLQSQIVHPLSSTIPHTSRNQSFRPEYNSVTNQNFDSDPVLNRPLSNIQKFFSQFKTVVSPHSQSSDPVLKPADYTQPPPPYNNSRFAKLFSRDSRPTSNLSSLRQHTQNSESKLSVDELVTKIQKFYSIPNIVAPPQHHDFDPAPHPVENAQQMLSRALGFNEQSYHNLPALAAPRIQGGPISNYLALMQQNPNSQSVPDFDAEPSAAEKFNSIPNIVAPPNNQHSDPELNITEHSPQNNSFYRAHRSNEQASQDASTFGDGSQSRGFGPTSTLAALTQNIENFESTVNKKSSSATPTSSSSNQNFSDKAVKPQKTQLDLANMPKFVIRVEQSANYEQVSSFNAFAQHNERCDSTLNPDPIPHSLDRDRASFVSLTYLQNILRGFKLASNLEPPISLIGLKAHAQNIDKAHCFEGQPLEKPNLNTTSSLKPKPSENKKIMPPPGFTGQPPPYINFNSQSVPSFFEHPPPNQKFNSLNDYHQQHPQTHNLSIKPNLFEQPPPNLNLDSAHGFNQEPSQKQNLNLLPSFYGHPPPNQKFTSAHDFHQQPPETPNLSPKSSFFQQPPPNHNPNSAHGFHHQPLQSQNVSLKPRFFGHPPPNQKFNSPRHDFHHQSSQTQNLSPKPVFFGEPQINRNFDPARDFNQQPLNNQALSPHNQNFDSAPIYNRLLPNIQRFFTASNPAAVPCNQNLNPEPKSLEHKKENQSLYGDSNKNNNVHLNMSNLDPNSIIDEICKLDDINIYLDSILNLEYGFLETQPNV